MCQFLYIICKTPWKSHVFFTGFFVFNACVDSYRKVFYQHSKSIQINLFAYFVLCLSKANVDSSDFFQHSKCIQPNIYLSIFFYRQMLTRLSFFQLNLFSSLSSYLFLHLSITLNLPNSLNKLCSYIIRTYSYSISSPFAKSKQKN